MAVMCQTIFLSRQREEAAFGPFGCQKSTESPTEEGNSREEKEENDVLECIQLLF